MKIFANTLSKTLIGLGVALGVAVAAFVTAFLVDFVNVKWHWPPRIVVPAVFIFYGLCALVFVLNRAAKDEIPLGITMAALVMISLAVFVDVKWHWPLQIVVPVIFGFYFIFYWVAKHKIRR